MNHTKTLPLLAVALSLACSRAHAADVVFDFEVLRYEAKMLASKPYTPARSMSPRPCSS